MGLTEANLEKLKTFDEKITEEQPISATLHEAELLKIAVRNLTEQDVMANFPLN